MGDDPYISPSDICVFLRMDEIMDLVIFVFKTFVLKTNLMLHLHWLWWQQICFYFFPDKYRANKCKTSNANVLNRESPKLIL